MNRFWPGQVTLVLPEARAAVAHLGADDGTVGIRCPDHELTRAIAARVGPIATTSANVHQAPTPVVATAVSEQLPGVDLVVDGGEPVAGIPSTVVDVTGTHPNVLRVGTVPTAQVIEEIQDNWYLVSVVDSDYVNGNIFDAFYALFGKPEGSAAGDANGRA